ncbi:hypothetical protein BOTBODRAFT_107034 [Botryobasidium botryosum FD-172 SS1]|uniref:C3H1-type domain-containing protein n=1 Tax=Botryobasidium botryosum (strain FD-172 SS1) TaxID=930990 RepID=A0A067MLV5_BOTB1|nr:hypothetical protein BOTBODRAFT_107034 [Botryobasidium botryosum FD-172 SS1]
MSLYVRLACVGPYIWCVDPLGAGSSHSLPAHAPGNMCNFYWSTGSCDRGHSCRFQHTVNPALRASISSPASDNTAVMTPQSIVGLLTENALDKLSGSSNDILFSTSGFSPATANHHMKKFLHPKFSFKTPQEMMQFINLLSSANSENGSWTPNDGQVCSVQCRHGEGIRRIGEILCFSDVSSNAGIKSLSFQQGYLRLLGYYASKWVAKSTLNHCVNALYSAVHNNLDTIIKTIEGSMDAIIATHTFKESRGRSSSQEISGPYTFKIISTVFFEYLTRFKQAVASNPQLPDFARKLVVWFETWETGISSSPPTFSDKFSQTEPATRSFLLRQLRSDVERLLPIVSRTVVVRERLESRSMSSAASLDAILAQLQREYVGPGEIREGGARHDNDKLRIADIKIAPTHEELISDHLPFLPANLPQAPHPFESGSMERHLDIQFRLLREELIAPIRSAVQLVVADMLKPARERTRLSLLLNDNGGRYKGFLDTRDSVMFSVYTGVTFGPTDLDRRGLSFGLEFDSPPGRARAVSSAVRAAYWESASRKRLMQGGLVALLWKSTSAEPPTVYLGVVSSSADDLKSSSRHSQHRLRIRVVFFDSTADLRLFQALRQPQANTGVRILLEAPVFYEGIRPFLEALKRDSALVPFPRYLAHSEKGSLNDISIDPPLYTTIPGKMLELKSLFPIESGVNTLPFSTTDVESVLQARTELKRASRLDPSQADAIVDALCREISLIQGPPGTGKSYTGVELIRVLIANKITPIILIAFTNHALDHMLLSVMDAGITSNIVRLGSRSANERIAELSLERLETRKQKGGLDRSIGREYRTLKETEAKMKELMARIARRDISIIEVQKYVFDHSPALHSSLEAPPLWIGTLFDAWVKESAEWTVAGRAKGATDTTRFTYWREAHDLAYLHTLHEPPTTKPLTPRLQPRNPFALIGIEPSDTSDSSDDDQASDSEMEAGDTGVIFSSAVGDLDNFPIGWPTMHPLTSGQEDDYCDDLASESDPADGPISSEDNDPVIPSFFSAIPQIPSGDRTLEKLIEENDMWDMSSTERNRLADFWVSEAKIKASHTQLQDFESLRDTHYEACTRYNSVKEQMRIDLLKETQLIGCTTTGAAKLTSLLKGFDPKIMIVEEAGQVLEAHILASLVISIQHLIMIGDPLQLRPNLENYSLRMDHPRGGKIYRFDQSLMERLSKAGFPMSRLDVQRRMRPSISSLISRNTLYPNLEDHELVRNYAPVRGIAKSVFFMSHAHKENGNDEDTMSKRNDFEVEMIRDLVLYFLRQGVYSEQGDIVILAAYLGQIARIRDKLAGLVTTVIDERDAAKLAEQEDDNVDGGNTSVVESVQVSKRVLIRTVDNFQGEEAKIIILSLIRNSGTPFDPNQDLSKFHASRSSIGFLKSENRTNVALSRAKHGLFVLGNAIDLASGSPMWAKVLSELQECNAIGSGFPIACHRHPDRAQIIDRPGILPIIAPDGGCLEPCNVKLPCGHTCPFKCHADDENHILPVCQQPCTKLCPLSHPCARLCSDNCGDCRFPIRDVALPCGHVEEELPCSQAQVLSLIKCEVQVEKKLLRCGHLAQIKCYRDPTLFDCQVRCGQPMRCCSRLCASRCHQCRLFPSIDSEADDQKSGESHASHPCGKELFCQHKCAESCAKHHICFGTCSQTCPLACTHHDCKKTCSAICEPCQEPCAWACQHHSCPLPCGSICARLPCDEPCPNQLRCGHACPSVCGEPCDTQTCVVCVAPKILDQIVGRGAKATRQSLGKGIQLDQRTITLSCHHIFTVQALDEAVGISDFYARNESGGWSSTVVLTPGLKKLPLCPNCRAPITALRYGRAYKRAALDLLQYNSARGLSYTLQSIHSKIVGFRRSVAQGEIEKGAKRCKLDAKALPNARKWKASQAAVREILNAQPTPLQAFDFSDHRFHCISPPQSKLWAAAVKPLLVAYANAIAVTSTQSPNLAIFETSPPTLDEKTTASADIQGDQRYKVEAYWATIEIRFLLAELAQAWLSVLETKRGAAVQEHCRLWSGFIHFILYSALGDAKVARELAVGLQAQQQIARSTVVLLRAELELFRFNFQMASSPNLSHDERCALYYAALEKMRAAQRFISETSTLQMSGDGDRWLTVNFRNPTRVLRTEWDSLCRAARGVASYSAESLAERLDIVRSRAFYAGLKHDGVFHRCKLGHLFVDGECRGANGTPTCPECTI